MPPAARALDAGPTVTWLGHATAVARFGAPATSVLFDPLLRSRARAAGPVDAVLVTHSHVDHLNRWSLKAVNRSAHLVVPKGAGAIVSDLGFARVTEMTADDELQIGALEITAVPTRHDRGRWKKGDGPDVLGYIVRANGATVHHGGDIDFSDHTVFDAIGKRHRIDATLLPIGGMMPVRYYRNRRARLDRGVHIDPDCALELFERLGARALVPVHWGTLHIPISPFSGPRKRMEQLLAERGVQGVHILAHGDSLGLRDESH